MRLLKFVPVVAMALLAGCNTAQPPSSAPAAVPEAKVLLVPSSERSPHFTVVNNHLELGGKFYGFVDVDGDTTIVATVIRRMADNIAKVQPMAAPFLKQDYEKIFDELGVSDIKAAGLSSVQEADGNFRNRVFFYMPNGRHGLFAGFGGAAAPYVYTKLAPADADFYSEGEIDLPAIYATIKAVVTRVGGEKVAAMMDAQLKAAGAPAGLSALEVIQSVKGRAVTVLRFDAEKNIALPSPKPINIPSFSLLVRIDGMGSALQKALEKLPVLEASQDGAMKIFSFKGALPLEGIKPVFAIENGALFLATNREFFDECRQRKTGLAESVEFQKALALVGPEGNGLAYVSPRFFSRLRQLAAMNPEAPLEAKRMFEMISLQMPEVTQPIIAERINLPDGILVRSHSYRSLKQDVAMIAVYNPVTIGFLAAMAIPAFQKVRENAHEKVITNNLRQFSAAADQYMMETGKDSAAYADLVGPDKLIPKLAPVAGEDYKRLVVHATDKSISVRTATGKAVVVRR